MRVPSKACVTLPKKKAAPSAFCKTCKAPKIRTGLLKDHVPVALHSGEMVTITAREVEGTAAVIGTTFKGLPHEVSAGSRILLSDGLIELRVHHVLGQDIECLVINGGTLGENQGHQFARRSAFHSRPYR